MDRNYFADGLRRNSELICQLVDGVADEQLRWREAPEKWSVLEVLVHLLDEERDDFSARLDLALHHSGEFGTSFDPEGRVKERRYNEADPAETLAAFREERARKVEWIRSLSDPDWTAIFPHPRAKLRAGDLLLSWYVHDLLHVRQIADALIAHAKQQAPDFRADYAG